jgi:O-antigen/teichoic acid export membrane protein
LGFFAAMAYLMVAGGMVINAAGQSSAPRLARYYSQRDSAAFRRLMLKLVGLALILGAGGIGVAVWRGRDVLTWLYRAEYAEHVEVFVWVMVAASISYFGSCLGYGITATRAFQHFLAPYFVLMVITFVASALLIPLMGIKGAAWTLCITGMVSCAAPIAAFQSLEKQHP